MENFFSREPGGSKKSFIILVSKVVSDRFQTNWGQKLFLFHLEKCTKNYTKSLMRESTDFTITLCQEYFVNEQHDKRCRRNTREMKILREEISLKRKIYGTSTTIHSIMCFPNNFVQNENFNFISCIMLWNKTVNKFHVTNRNFFFFESFMMSKKIF